MTKDRFNYLMKQYPNWVAEGNIHEVYTFFEGFYTHKGGIRTPEEKGNYSLEENDNGVKIDLEESQRKYIVNEDMRGEFPVIQLFPAHGYEGDVVFLIPKR